MKIGILTFVNTLNYGAVLQAYALQEKIKDFGCEAEIIQYTNEAILNKEKGNSLKSMINPKKLFRKLIMGSGMKRKEKAFNQYEKEYIISGDNFDGNNIIEINKNYDKFITGSDQVWNMYITENDWHFYLDFVDSSDKKISYAPSFGNVEFPVECKEKAGILLNDFSKLSVREASGQKLIKELTGREATIVVDPTLLLTKQEWESKIKFTPKLKHYILVYFPHNKQLVFDFVEKLKLKTGLPVVYLSISPRKQKGTQTIYDTSPDEFLGWIKNADYVVTGSFHGTAFSINFEKQFFYEPLSQNGVEGRIDNIVRITGTQNRCIVDAKFDDIIDYSSVRIKLEKLRNESTIWLRNSLDIDSLN
ncbi:MAG: polysaccharide pyruvyl transferase family protein [Acutalibacteraceae bacterium]|nr:polysaccharide pyruvyl transferase family protein [Acutalibacteraceae bacterium]